MRWRQIIGINSPTNGYFLLHLAARFKRACDNDASQKGVVGMAESPRLIKKYPNRRLYDTAMSGYITLAEVKQLVLDGVIFKVTDAKSSEDLTRSILLQIILEDDAVGTPMFSNDMLRQMIGFYASAVQGPVGQLLEQNVRAMMLIQAQMTEQAGTMMGGANKVNPKDMWSQFLTLQAPQMQGMLGNYFEQSSKVFMDMQKQMQAQSKTVFPTFPFPAWPGAETKK
jgi:polyhydroxyalkanoate synthesis repressor PhaR